jgi:hypothetical protein
MSRPRRVGCVTFVVMFVALFVFFVVVRRAGGPGLLLSFVGAAISGLELWQIERRAERRRH